MENKAEVYSPLLNLIKEIKEKAWKHTLYALPVTMYVKPGINYYDDFAEAHDADINILVRPRVSRHISVNPDVFYAKMLDTSDRYYVPFELAVSAMLRQYGSFAVMEELPNDMGYGSSEPLSQTVVFAVANIPLSESSPEFSDFLDNSTLVDVAGIAIDIDSLIYDDEAWNKVKEVVQQFADSNKDSPVYRGVAVGLKELLNWSGRKSEPMYYDENGEPHFVDSFNKYVSMVELMVDMPVVWFVDKWMVITVPYYKTYAELIKELEIG